MPDAMAGSLPAMPASFFPIWLNTEISIIRNLENPKTSITRYIKLHLTMKQRFSILASLAFLAMQSHAQVAHFDMSLDGGKITEGVASKQFAVNSQLPACTVKGLEGDALLFDGWSNYISAQLPSTISYDEFTFTILLAPQSYPMMRLDVAEDTPTFGTICGNLSADGKSGFALKLSSQGDLQLAYGSAYSNGYATSLKGNKRLPRGKWSRLTFVISKSGNTSTLYLNGENIASAKSNRYGIKPSTESFMIGKDQQSITAYGLSNLNINTYVGLIDDIALYDRAFTADEVAALPDNGSRSLPDFNFPAERYAQGNAALWRPQFHGMPSGGWTNESHGLTYSDGRYHVFFQKNANGPYMSRLHWGHISSDNLCSWIEEPIAFGPDESYDIKGCWSGCVFEDGAITGGKTGALYTAVDNAKATICQATATDQTLKEWSKAAANPLVNGRPQGLSDDFRDPYFFTAGGQKYIIVGTSKNNLGACTLHKYNNGTWSNDGTIFFQATSASQHGTFWEMPNVTDMGNGKWLFTCTPLGTGSGVRTLYWIGTIGADGKFVAEDMTPQYLEVSGISRDGYGLLSPSIYQRDGRTILLGIVPDKLPTDKNLEIGWAHNYSLPREVRLSDDGKSLWQKPCPELEAMRSSAQFSYADNLQGAMSLSPVSGCQIEMLGEFTVGDAAFGFNFLKSGDQKASLTYNPASNQLSLDITSLQRQVNDGVYGGVYKVTLPERPATGDKLKLQVYLDGSIADIFIADKWAFSVRLFPTDANAVEAEVFADGTTAASVKAWVLDAKGDAAAIESVRTDAGIEGNGGCYNLLGQHVSASTSGVIINNGRKYVNR